MADKKRLRVRLYFVKFPKWTLGSIIIGFLLFALNDGLGSQFLGIAAMGVGALISFLWITMRAKDQQMDTWLEEDIEHLKPRALTKGDLDPSEIVREPVVVVGPRFRSLGGAFFGFRRGGDRRARFSPVNVTIINFAEHQLVTYQCALDLTTGKALNECIDEYFYNDIVSVATKSETFTYGLQELDNRILSRVPKVTESAVNGTVQVNSAQIFSLSTSGGTSVRVVLNDPVLIDGLGGGELPVERADQAVTAVKKMLREKKIGALPLRSAGI